MPDTIKEFIRIIAEERSWSWSIVGIIYMIVYLILRSWFMGPLVRQAKMLKSKYYSEIQKNYIKTALLGWLLFLVSLGLTLYMWAKDFEISWDLLEVGMIQIAILSLLLSITLHVFAIGRAGLKTLLKVAAENQ